MRCPSACDPLTVALSFALELPALDRMHAVLADELVSDAAGRRTIPLPRFVIDELTTHCAGKAPGDLVFAAPAGGTIRASEFRKRIWYPACIAAGLGTSTVVDKREHYDGLRLHDLRHSAVALWIAAGASAKEIATRAGHTSVSVVLDR